MPLDPGKHWLEAGITGLARQREWDAVATADAPGEPGDEVAFVALPDGRTLVENGPAGFDPGPFAAAFEGRIAPPFRAVGVRRPELWVVGACAIEVAELAPDPRADEIEIVQTGDGTDIRMDGVPSLEPVPELERIGRERSASYVARARRLEGQIFEVEVEPL